MLAISNSCRQSLLKNLSLSSQTRSVSSSPYGRTHVWRRRPPTLPNPVVPKFPQLVIRSDGTSFTHWTTSPRSRIRLTRDTTNNPAWNTSLWLSEQGFEEEAAATGRLGRFNRKFEGLGSAASHVEWSQELGVSEGESQVEGRVKGGKPDAKKK